MRFDKRAVPIQACDKHLKYSDFPVHVFEDRIVLENVEQCLHAEDAAANGMIRLQQNRQRDELFARNEVELEHDKL